MVWAVSLGLPMSLDGAANALRLPLEKDPARQKLTRYPLPEAEWEAYRLDQRINDGRGRSCAQDCDRAGR